MGTADVRRGGGRDADPGAQALADAERALADREARYQAALRASVSAWRAFEALPATAVAERTAAARGCRAADAALDTAAGWLTLARRRRWCAELEYQAQQEARGVRERFYR